MEIKADVRTVAAGMYSLKHREKGINLANFDSYVEGAESIAEHILKHNIVTEVIEEPEYVDSVKMPESRL